MSLLIAMFPIYVMGNFHCLGMCGPIALILGTSPFRGFYLLGRLISFTLAGFIAGAFGEVLGIALKEYAGALSFLMGFVMAASGFFILTDTKVSFAYQFEKIFAPFREKLNHLLLSREPWPLFLVGFFTIALPCGQTLLVYSACALSGSTFVGTLNGFAFGLMTTPSLYLAMQARGVLERMRPLYRPIVGGMACIIGLIAVLRALAEWGIIHSYMIY